LPQVLFTDKTDTNYILSWKMWRAGRLIFPPTSHQVIVQ
jgi:hypothetical protein